MFLQSDMLSEVHNVTTQKTVLFNTIYKYKYVTDFIRVGIKLSNV